MKRRAAPIRRVLQRFSPEFRARGATLRKFSNSIGLVHFGTVYQHDDEHDSIKGFTASLTHHDSHYAVGTYNGFNIRVVNRFDISRIAGNPAGEQYWTIVEIELETRRLPHLFFVPTGREGGEYGRVYATHPAMQPLNSMLLRNRSPEFHGRFQIVSRPAQAHKLTHFFPSPVIVGIGTRFWPHGIEVQQGKLLVYITQRRLTKTALEMALGSALWLAETIDEIAED